jgi:hypothetical protein
VGKEFDMIRTIYTPESKQVTLPIPERYVGTRLEIIIFPLTPAAAPSHTTMKMPVFGCAKGKFKLSDDFDAPLDDFAEYMA